MLSKKTRVSKGYLAFVVVFVLLFQNIAVSSAALASGTVSSSGTELQLKDNLIRIPDMSIYFKVEGNKLIPLYLDSTFEEEANPYVYTPVGRIFYDEKTKTPYKLTGIKLIYDYNTDYYIFEFPSIREVFKNVRSDNNPENGIHMDYVYKSNVIEVDALENSFSVSGSYLFPIRDQDGQSVVFVTTDEKYMQADNVPVGQIIIDKAKQRAYKIKNLITSGYGVKYYITDEPASEEVFAIAEIPREQLDLFESGNIPESLLEGVTVVASMLETGEVIEALNIDNSKILLPYGGEESVLSTGFETGDFLVNSDSYTQMLMIRRYFYICELVDRGIIQRITDSLPTGISLDKSQATVGIGESTKLMSTITPENAAIKNVIWSSSDPAIAVVGSDGAVKGVAAGTALITATTLAGGYTSSCAVTVTPVAVTGVTLDKDTLWLNTGTSGVTFAYLYPTVSPSSATNKYVTWSSSNPAVATVSYGSVTPLTVGTTTITVTTVDGGYKAECLVRVVAPVTGVSLDKSSTTLGIGESTALQVTVMPSSAERKTVAWTSSNPGIATVDHEGRVTGVSEGNATITVTTVHGVYKASCAVKVNKPVTGLILDKNTAKMNVGTTSILVATISPFDANIKDINWSSSNTAVATVVNGTVTAIAEGTATITATTVDKGYKASCVVTVVKQPLTGVTGVTFNKRTMTLIKGTTGSITATVNPLDAANKNVTWSSSNPAVATVVNGMVTALEAGTAVITATTEDGGYSEACTVNVILKVTGVTLNKSAITLYKGIPAHEVYNLSATVNPSNATNKNVMWFSSNPAVATVINGQVRAVAPGKATITVLTLDGGYKATCEVTVNNFIIY